VSGRLRTLDQSAREQRTTCPFCGQAISGISVRGPSDQRATPCGHPIRHYTMTQITSDSDASGGTDR